MTPIEVTQKHATVVVDVIIFQIEFNRYLLSWLTFTGKMTRFLFIFYQSFNK
jgi:hypothetical protein